MWEPVRNVKSQTHSAVAATGALGATAAATGALGAAKRSYPMSEVRGRSREDPMPEERRPRGVTPLPRSGAAAESARLQRSRNSREELPKSEVRGGGQEELPHALTPKARGGGQEDQTHARGQGRRPGGPTPRQRSGGCPGTGGPRGAIPR